MTEYPPPPPPPPGGYPPAGGYPGPGGYPPPAGGYPSPGGYPPPGYPPSTGTNGLAIASLVCSLLGLACYGFTALVGIVLGVIALNQVKQTGQQGRGMALAGIIIGGVVIALWIIGVILWFAIFAATYSTSY